MFDTIINPKFVRQVPLQHFTAETFPRIHPVDWLYSHFAVGGGSPLQRLSGMYTAHMTHIEPQSGFTWHPHRGLEIFTWVLEGTLHHEDSTGGEGDINAGEFQRMFSGDLILHQELNQTDRPVRVIQIWFAADRKHRLLPHYQQLSKRDLPARREGDATVYSLIGEESPVETHMVGAPRVTATALAPGGKVELEPPRADENLFLYITDGTGQLNAADQEPALGQYDVILAQPATKNAKLKAAEEQPLHFMNFYLPKFLE